MDIFDNFLSKKGIFREKSVKIAYCPEPKIMNFDRTRPLYMGGYGMFALALRLYTNSSLVSDLKNVG